MIIEDVKLTVFRRPDPGHARSAMIKVEVVPGSGTGGLTGLTGSGSYAATAMQYTMELDYVLG